MDKENQTEGGVRAGVSRTALSPLRQRILNETNGVAKLLLVKKHSQMFNQSNAVLQPGTTPLLQPAGSAALQPTGSAVLLPATASAHPLSPPRQRAIKPASPTRPTPPTLSPLPPSPTQLLTAQQQRVAQLRASLRQAEQEMQELELRYARSSDDRAPATVFNELAQRLQRLSQQWLESTPLDGGVFSDFSSRVNRLGQRLQEHNNHPVMLRTKQSLASIRLALSQRLASGFSPDKVMLDLRDTTDSMVDRGFSIFNSLFNTTFQLPTRRGRQPVLPTEFDLGRGEGADVNDTFAAAYDSDDSDLGEVVLYTDHEHTRLFSN